MNYEIKTLAFYLPQFHEIPENNNWWGKGFTEWVNVKKAKPLFDGHAQPKKPVEKGYYDLSDVNVMRWQAQIAKDYGLFGFCFYHYWFNDKPLLEKPLLNWLDAKDIDLPYCFCWANESWTNGWAKAEASVIMEQKYGSEQDWKKHFDFLLPFFKDQRYIKEDNMPMLVIYRPYLCDCLIKMLNFWKKLSIENGFAGLKIASQRFEKKDIYRKLYDYCDYHIEYQPGLAREKLAGKKKLFNYFREFTHDAILKCFNKDLSFRQKTTGPVKVSYDEIWNQILLSQPDSNKSIAGAFVNWDNTPRHKRRGSVFDGVTPEKFEKYLTLQAEHIKSSYKNNYMFIFAWNEWGEGGYLEPDEDNGYSYLTAVKNALVNQKNIGEKN